MKKSILFFVLLLVVLVMVACERSSKSSVVPTKDPMLALAENQYLIVTKIAAIESREETPDPAINALSTQVAELQSSLEDLKSQPTTVIVQKPEVTETVFVGDWDIQYFEGATEEMEDWVFPDLEPSNWPQFPNVDNGQYQASEGLEYGEDLSVFCQQSETCDFVIPARHYRLYTGDYKFSGVGECIGEGKKGCAIAVFNVGEITATFEDEWMDAGFTVSGRYWDGNYLSQAIWALLSHASSNMINLDSELNPSTITNAGSNCSVVPGCESVDNTFVITSGNEILMIGHQTINK